MSEIMLNVRDAVRALHRTIHGSEVEYVVAALSADPETIEELEAALARFLPAKSARSFFAHWRSGENLEPWDAGLGVIDLAARVVMIDSTYSQPGPCEAVAMKDRRGEDVGIPYHVADDWKFLYDASCWEGTAEMGRRERAAAVPFDARPVLYGQLCSFIADACRTALAESAPTSAAPPPIAAIHARWLMTPRPDLSGQAPRDVLLTRRHHLDHDLQHRATQWSFVGRCPPGLAPESAAHRHAGFGTHEIVVYYDLVRHLLHACWEQLAQQQASTDLAVEVRRLEALRDQWLAAPNVEIYSGGIPAVTIAHERARVPEASSGKDHVIDCDCPLCQMMADEDFGPSFWHLDGSHMDQDFEFSFHATRAEWEAEQRKWAEFDRKWDADERARKAAQPPSVWQRSFVAADAMDGAPTLAVFALGARLAELTEDLKEAGAAQETIDNLNRAFGNLTEVVKHASAALIEPVIERLNETLSKIADANSALADKCADLDRQLGTFRRRLIAEPWQEGELPF